MEHYSFAVTCILVGVANCGMCEMRFDPGSGYAYPIRNGSEYRTISNEVHQ